MQYMKFNSSKILDKYNDDRRREITEEQADKGDAQGDSPAPPVSVSIDVLFESQKRETQLEEQGLQRTSTAVRRSEVGEELAHLEVEFRKEDI